MKPTEHINVQAEHDSMRGRNCGICEAPLLPVSFKFVFDDQSMHYTWVCLGHQTHVIEEFNKP